MPEAETIDVDALRSALERGEYDLVCVLGPTASGKTRYAVHLARELGNAEILSADSRQVYRGMDIGTGKDLAEYGEVTVHLLDLVPAGAKYNIYQYQAAFAEAWADVRGRGRIPILCGGSGLWIESVTRGYKFEKGNGVPPESLPQKVFYIGTLVSREERVERIDRRLDERLKEGLVEEIRGLLETVPAQDLIYYGLEYKFVTQYVLGELSYEDMVIALGNAIHQFAKRQMTWFRRDERIHWLDMSGDPIGEAAGLIRDF
ncbi:MAG: tRNA (adenosine(37)-N6)-dimethylallyltransferase MiaA, partial [Bacteroidales bacterium]|nr:tRNA (adenosine(37)-N6)-dimethylallyltransferase MiaA [Bacteroidales bacterium]